MSRANTVRPRSTAAQVRGSDLMSSPAVVKDFLRTRLGTMPHEVFSPVSETPSGVSRTLRYALLALTLLIVFGYGVWVTMTVVLGRLPSLVEMISVAVLLGLLVVLAMRWLHNRRMRRMTVDLQDSALW
jgi:cation transporter-like permease